MERPSWTQTDGAEHADALRQILTKLGAWGAARGWAGPDPYEGLNTPAAKMLRRSKMGRQAVIQTYRRAAFAPPWPLRARTKSNAKALGLVLSGYSMPPGRELPAADDWVRELTARIESLRLLQSEAWGYHFDVQTRHLFYDALTPNAVATCFVVDGLLDAGAAGVLPEGPDAALRARPFLESLWTENNEFGPYFGYVATGSEPIHNANLMVCGTLARLDHLDPRPDLADRVERAAATTISLRREDGLWPYGERADLEWRDNFHTAYILEGLARIHGRWARYNDLITNATSAWLNQFFDTVGTASYHPDRIHPIDAHSAASAVHSLCVLSALGPEWKPLAGAASAVATRAVEVLWLEDEGRFASHKNEHFTNRREFMRWTNAPMFEALARLLSLRSPRR